VTVVEAPVIDRLAFEGNSRIKDEQLQQEIQSKARGTLSRAIGAGRRPAHYRGLSPQWRFDVTVVPKIIQRPNNRVDLVFEVREGEEDRDSSPSSSSATTPIPTIGSRR
jgi:outer membrane protein insertion porin family